MATNDVNEVKKKRDYTNILLGIGGVALAFSHIACFISGYNMSWNICNNQISMKEAEYVRRGYLSQEQIAEVYDAVFKNKV